MKKQKMISLWSIMIAAITLVITANITNQSFAGITSSKRGPTPFTISISDDVKSLIVREDNDNASVFKFNGAAEQPVFLFSVNKVTQEQWMQLKSSFEHAKVIDNKSGYIWFVEKTDKSRIKGSGSEQYQMVYTRLDEMINSIKVNE